MESANGFVLLDGFGRIHHASWRAPFFSLIIGDEPGDSMLIHCETIEDARRAGGIVFSHDFTQIPA